MGRPTPPRSAPPTTSRGLVVAVAMCLAAAACSISDATSETTTTVVAGPAPIDLSLEATGLGELEFGLAVDAVIEGVTAVAGGADRDSGWIDPDSIYGRCPGVALRAVGWGSLLTLFRADDGSGDGGSFFAYTYGFDDDLGTIGGDPYELGLETDRGIGLGSTRRDVRNAYGDRLTEEGDAALDLWTFTIGPPAGPGIRGQLDGPGEEAAVVFLASTPGCVSRSGE